jgi:sugar/nucleoside kinase (ribokinase family)
LVMTRDTIIAAGHCCLDVIPAFAAQADSALVPGRLLDVGPAVLAPGGAVSNVGLALHHLGAPVRLLGKVGDDAFGHILLDAYAQADLAEGMLTSSGETTSYSVVISQPGSDRIFLHCPGANHTFSAAEVLDQDLTGAAIFHFGYPPLMRQMYLHEGAALAQIFQTIKAQGIFTSLDMARPDAASEAGQVDWQVILKRTLPFVDAFLPSIDELLFMLDRERYEEARNRYGDDHLIEGVDGPRLEKLVARLITWGAAIVAVKLGDQGLYLGTTADPSRWQTRAATLPVLADTAWRGRRLFTPCYQVDVAGTTGAGDATIAGFLLGLLKGSDPEETMRGAVAVGACSVEQVDATTGIPSWELVQRRVRAGWAQRPVRLSLPSWTSATTTGIWHGPSDPGSHAHQ